MSAYQHGLGTSIFAGKAPEEQYRGYATSEGFGVFVKTPERVHQSLDCPHTFPKTFLGGFLQFIHSTSESEEAKSEEAN